MKIVIDTNVLISAFVFKGFSATVFDYCVIQEQIYLSAWILDELSEKMKEKFRISADKINAVVELIREKAKVEIPNIPLPDVCRDKDDNHILQLADFIHADFIITGDKDLLILNRYQSTDIVAPREFHNRFIKNKDSHIK